tara:strand:+ start:3385 stop:4104 length:720 start_codon:yes stop_codon:yes gene_type:complete
MQETVSKLIELQKIDTRLLEIEQIKGDLPSIVENTETKVNMLQSEVTNNDVEIKNIEKQVRELSAKIDDSDEKLKKYKDQLYLVSSNKEYDALMLEIDHIKTFLDGVENNILELEDQKNTLEEKNKSNALDIKTNQDILKESTLELKDAMDSTKSEENSLNDDRDVLVKTIADNFVLSYEKLKKARDGKAMVSINRNACGYCFNQLPPQFVIEVKQNNSIKNCDSCGVYLFYEEELIEK